MLVKCLDIYSNCTQLWLLDYRFEKLLIKDQVPQNDLITAIWVFVISYSHPRLQKTTSYFRIMQIYGTLSAGDLQQISDWLMVSPLCPGATTAPSLIFILPGLFYIRIIPTDQEPMNSRPKIQVGPYVSLTERGEPQSSNEWNSTKPRSDSVLMDLIWVFRLCVLHHWVSYSWPWA